MPDRIISAPMLFVTAKFERALQRPGFLCLVTREPVGGDAHQFEEDEHVEQVAAEAEPVRAESGGLEGVDNFIVGAGDVRTLDASTIHSVQARGDRYLGAIHVYGGDLFGTPRSTWRGDVEYPMDESALPAFFNRLRHHETQLGRAMTPDEIATFLAVPTASS